MDKIDQNVSRENIYDKILLLKALVLDLETDMNEHTDLKTQMTIYKSILPIRLRINTSWGWDCENILQVQTLYNVYTIFLQ